MTQHSETTPLQISEAAIKQLTTVLSQKPGGCLRITVQPGGCNGFEYQLNLDTQINSDDVVVNPTEHVKVIIDETSLELIFGAELDYETDLIGSAFKIKNPKATSACGCGNSFSV